MNGFLRRMLNLDALDDAIYILRSQQSVIDDQNKMLGLQQAEIQHLKLDYSRWGQNILEQFLIALDNPEHEDELRERLTAAVQDMADEVARLEEFSR